MGLFPSGKRAMRRVELQVIHGAVALLEKIGTRGASKN
jgi:hypothetical protein